MNWTPRHTIAAGFALILATNAIVLGGVAYNRGGEPEALLRLSHRELTAPGAWGFWKENSGLAMQLQWRVVPSTAGEGTYFYYRSEPDWLDAAKLTELGFDVARIERAAEADRVETLPRDVLLALEFDGTAHRDMVQRAERDLAAQEARLAASPRDAPIKNAVEGARKRLDTARNAESRLYVVDAGLDAAKLRAKYPDRSRYTIVGGQVRVYRWYDERAIKRPPIRGRVSTVNVDEINVPIHLRGVIGRALGFEATVAFGRRLEPWFVAATPRPKPPAPY